MALAMPIFFKTRLIRPLSSPVWRLTNACDPSNNPGMFRKKNRCTGTFPQRISRTSSNFQECLFWSPKNKCGHWYSMKGMRENSKMVSEVLCGALATSHELGMDTWTEKTKGTISEIPQSTICETQLPRTIRDGVIQYLRKNVRQLLQATMKTSHLTTINHCIPPTLRVIALHLKDRAPQGCTNASEIVMYLGTQWWFEHKKGRAGSKNSGGKGYVPRVDWALRMPKYLCCHNHLQTQCPEWMWWVLVAEKEYSSIELNASIENWS